MIVTTREQLRQVAAHYASLPAFAFDVETRGTREKRDKNDKPALDPETNEVLWISLASAGRHDVIPMGHPLGELIETERKEKEAWYDESQPTKSGRGKKKWRTITIPARFTPPPPQLLPAEVFEALRPAFFGPARLIGHKVKFDLRTIAKYYDWVIPPGPYGDTLVMQHIVNENIPATGLDDLVKRYFGFTYEQLGKVIEESPFSAVARYAGFDAKYAWLLFKRLLKSIERQGLQGVYDLDMDTLGALAEMEQEGAQLDEDGREALDTTLSEQLEECRADLYRYAGEVWNCNSQPEQGHFVYEVRGHKVKVWTAGGKNTKPRPSVAESSLTAYADKDTAVARLAEYNELRKLHSTYVAGIGKQRDYNGRVHTEFNLHVAVTGRLSSSGPNMQNIPRPGEKNATAIRGMFVAPPGYVLIVCDYGQQEYRVLAHFSKDERYTDIFINHPELDPHVMTGVLLFDLAPEEVTKELRTVAKNTGFAISYGAGPDKVAAMSGVTLKRAKEVMRRHEKTFPGIYAWIAWEKKHARRRKPPHGTTLFGRKRRLGALMAHDRGVRGRAERQLINFKIQGSSAEITKLSIVRYRHIAPPEMPLMLTVHDENVALCPEDRAEEGKAIMEEAMIGAEMQKLLRVPLTADAKIVTRWSDAK